MALKRDPVPILLLASALLLLQGVLVWVASTAVGITVTSAPVWVIIAVGAGAVVLTALLHAGLLATGARTMGVAAHGGSRWMSLLGLWLLTGPLRWAGVGLAAGAIGLAILLAGRGWLTTGAWVMAFGMTAALLVNLAFRAVFAIAAIDVVVLGYSSLHAFWRALRRSPRAWAAAFVLLGFTDVLLALVSLCLAPLALPAYPLGDLAILHWWRREEAA